MSIKATVITRLEQELNGTNALLDVNYLDHLYGLLDYYLAFTKRNYWTETKRVDCLVAICLVQLSLHIHSQLTNVATMEDAAYLLEADLFSSRYYAILVKENEFNLLNKISLAIKQQNASQIRLNLLDIKANKALFILAWFNQQTWLAITLINTFQPFERQRSMIEALWVQQLTNERLKLTADQKEKYSLSQACKPIAMNVAFLIREIDHLLLTSKLSFDNLWHAVHNL
ncbi:Heptaprenyl diphosphate synthase (HEPPP synthase) subunit 1 [Amphibacillus marinus]|uniref:Heptaprenyl diphosphate synthase (HEPPP synthase) subunit 1 n=1 Tax=Amphibacillus marinus TaxID=872970 RepID=A0A1H8GG00_9BACI|nr:heptaprenyl diphosphate synthase component 1 [Amphibacillus marinus]SEN42705.1 Heptaprenyl diphosphate synthase (HEPPP synthase) subunit 1 [Amphibacillus marinus]